MNETVKPPITYYGSKSSLVKQIVRHFPVHHTFVDVFGGSGAVLLGKSPSKVEVYNDLDQALFTLFKVLADPEKTKILIEQLELTLYSRQQFNLSKDAIHAVDNEVELAKHVFVLHRQSHSGEGKKWSYCVKSDALGYSASVRRYHAGIERLPQISHRLRRVQIENLPWEEILCRYDRPNTLFYLDPPYLPDTRVSGGYRHEMTLEDHKRLVSTLLSVKGKCVLSGYAGEMYEDLERANWRKIEKTTTCQSSQNKASRVECLWISPSARKEGLTRQQSAYRTHEIRTSESTCKIQIAIEQLKKEKKKITKAEVARRTGISRSQISRRYSHLLP